MSYSGGGSDDEERPVQQDRDPSLDDELREVCQTQGFPESQFAAKAAKATRLDILQGVFVTCNILRHFPNATEVMLLQVPTITDMRGLTTCRNLQRLWISECRLTAISDLNACPNLEVLNLDCNRISVIQGLERLTNLKSLWLNDNRIKTLDGLENLVSLTQLCVARNEISKIGACLDPLTNLQELNISDNLVGEFSEIANLARLPTLKSLICADPHFGSNPVCALCNYQTYVLYQLNQLETLDTILVPEDAKALAEATYVKKKMYYNMRIKTLKRNTTNVIRRAAEALNARMSQLNLNYNVVQRQFKDTQRLLQEREWHEAQGPGAVGGSAQLAVTPEFWGQLEKKLESLGDAIAHRRDDAADMEARLHDLQRQLMEISNMNVSRMLIELGSGGNIRLEDGKPTDMWYTSCVELIRSRFFQADFASIGVKAIHVHRVTRVHNRFLRNRFDERMSNILTQYPVLAAPAADGSKRRALEYLFYSIPQLSETSTGLANQLQRIAQDGFSESEATAQVPVPPLPPCAYEPPVLCFAYGSKRFPDQLETRQQTMSDAITQHRAAAGESTKAVPLTNSMTFVEMPRLAQGVASVLRAHGKARTVDERRNFAPTLTAKDETPTAWLQRAGVDIDAPGVKGTLEHLRHLSAKPGPRLGLDASSVVEGAVMIAKVFLGDTATLDPETGAVQPRTTDADAAGVKRHSNIMPCDPLTHSVVRSRSADGKQRQWGLLEPALALPEYIVEYQIEWDTPNNVGGQSSTAASTGATMTSELSALAELSVGWRGGATSGHTIRLTPQSEADLRPLARPLAGFVNRCRNTGGADTDLAVLDMPPVLPTRPKITDITSGVIKGASTLASPSSVLYLNLHGNSLRSSRGLEACIHLKVLVLSFNEISVVEGLSTMQQLERLELGFNLIKRISGLDGLTNLRVLELNNNLLYQIEDVRVLRTCTPQLARLALRNNGLCDAKNYRAIVVSSLRNLVELDGRSVDESQRRAAASVATRISAALLRRRCQTSTGRQSCAEPALGDLNVSDDEDEDGKAHHHHDDWADTRWCPQAEAVDLSRLRLRRIQNLERLVRLRSLNLADNEIQVVEGLETLSLLEDLSLEENRISRLEGLSSLKFLKKLDLGKNRITKIEGLGSLQLLSQLSLEDNEIVTLEGIPSLPALMELYIGNNKIGNIKDILFLKDLPKLIILDLSGNPLCAHATYRLYSVYHLRKLKVLDGVGVDSNEQAASRDKYAGRLTTEFLEEKIGHAYFEAIRDLDLPSLRIREIETLSGDTFRCLSYLNLDNNCLTGGGLAGLAQLPHLSTLRLNHNRLTSLLPDCVAVPANGNINNGVPAGQPGGTVGSFARLEVLQLGFNQIRDIASLGLYRLPALKVLYLQGNDISKISGLETCYGLRELVLDNNRIKVIDPMSFVALTSLTELRLQENGLKTLSNLQHLVSLETLALSHNRINDVAELDKLAVLATLQHLWVANNPIARKQLYRPGLVKRLQTLRSLDGRDVTADERERADALFAPDPRPAPMYLQQPDPRMMQPMPAAAVGAQAAGPKVQVKMTAVNFEALGGYSRPSDGAMNMAVDAQFGQAQGYVAPLLGVGPGAAMGMGGDLLLPLGRGGVPMGRRDPSPVGFDSRRAGPDPRRGAAAERTAGPAVSTGRMQPQRGGVARGAAAGAAAQPTSPRYFGRR